MFWWLLPRGGISKRMGGTNGASPDEISLWRVTAQMFTHAIGNLTTIIVLLSCSPQNPPFSADMGGNKVQEWELAWIWMHKTCGVICLLDISRNGRGIAASPVPEPGTSWKNDDRSRYKNIYRGNQVQSGPAQPVWSLQNAKSLVKQLLLKLIPFPLTFSGGNSNLSPSGRWTWPLWIGRKC